MAHFKTNAVRILEKEKVPFTMHSYPVGDGAIDGIAIATKMKQPLAQVFKTLVTQGTSKNYYVFVVPVAGELDLKAAAKTVGEKAVELIKAADLLKVTGYIRGGCSPVGMKKQFPTVFDQTCLDQNTIFVSAGKIGYQIETQAVHLIRLINAQCAPLVQKNNG